MQKLRPYHIEALYDTLSKTPCGQYVGGKRRDLSPKQQKRTLSGTTLHEVHQLLHNSFLLAVEWGILIKSPVPVSYTHLDVYKRQAPPWRQPDPA